MLTWLKGGTAQTWAVAAVVWAGASAVICPQLPAEPYTFKVPWASRILGILPDGETIATEQIAGDSRIRFWRLPTGQPVKYGGSPPEVSLLDTGSLRPGFSGGELDRPSVILPDGRTIVVAIRDEMVWFDVRSRTELRRRQVEGGERHPRDGVSAASVDGRYLQMRGYVKRGELERWLAANVPAVYRNLRSVEVVEVVDGESGALVGRLYGVTKAFYDPRSGHLVGAEDGPPAYLPVRVWVAPLNPSLRLVLGTLLGLLAFVSAVAWLRVRGLRKRARTRSGPVLGP